jgi:beta-lactamase regulating signal transducer with metallopeptidase domain
MMAGAIDLQSLAQLSSERMLNSTVEGIGIALLAWMLLRAIGRESAGRRFAICFSALLGIAALPLFGQLGSGGAELTKRSGITLPGSWAFYIFAGWLLIAAVGLVRVGVGFSHLSRLRRSSVRIEVTALDPLLRKTLEEFDSPRSVAVCVSEHLPVPTAIGFMRPAVVIPAWAMRELSAPELNAILLHELAHLRRWDDWTNLVQKIVGALLFFHPAVWWIEKRLSLEREMACDDAVLAETTSPRMYAECLISLAEKSFLRRGLRLAQAAVSRMRDISLRVSRILEVNRPAASPGWRPAPVLLTGASLVCLVALSYTPNLVSFENESANVPAAPVAAIASSGVPTSLVSPVGSPVIPARLEVRREANHLVPAVQRTSKPAMIPARAVEPRGKSPVLVRSGRPERDTLVLVIETQVMEAGQYDRSGSVVLHLCVWQVTVRGPSPNRVEQGIIAKSI